MCFMCPILLSNASIAQWPVGSNGCNSLVSWEYHTWCIYQERIIGPEITHQVPQTRSLVFNVPYRPIQPSFLSSRLRVMAFLTGRLGVSPISRHRDWIIWSKITHLGPPEMVFNFFMCFTCPIVLSNASIPQWPVVSNGMFLNGRLGVSHFMDIPKRTICPEITHQVHLTWFSMFNVPYRSIQPSFLSGRLGVMGVPHWPGQILHI